jgi:hypothetical protein
VKEAEAIRAAAKVEVMVFIVLSFRSILSQALAGTERISVCDVHIGPIGSIRKTLIWDTTVNEMLTMEFRTCEMLA